MKTKKTTLAEAIRLKVKHNLTNKAFVELYEHLTLCENPKKGNFDSEKKYWLDKVKNDYAAITSIPDKYALKNVKDYKEIALAAVKKKWYALTCVPDKYALKNVEEYIEIVKAAVKQDRDAWMYVPPELKDEIRQELGL